MLTLSDYLMGRAQTHAAEFSQAIADAGQALLMAVNPLLDRLERIGVVIETDPRTGTPVSSGWRPPSLNATIPGASLRSDHMIGRAIDIYDPDGDLDAALLANPHLLPMYGLSMEHPAVTKGWCHLTDRLRLSGNRIFYP